MMIYNSENKIVFRKFDEDMLETLVEGDVEVGFVCAACNRRNCVRPYTFEGKEHEGLDCDWLIVVDRTHYRPICRECFATFGKPRSTAEGLFGL